MHGGFYCSTLSQGKPLVEESCISMMDTFEPFTETDIRQLLKKSSNAFCAVDTIFTWLVKDSLDILINPITALVRVISDIILSIDQGMPLIFVLPDLSVPFNTVDHNILSLG